MHFHLVYNSKSGQKKGQAVKVEAEKLCAESGHSLSSYDFSSSPNALNIVREAVERAAQDGGILIAAGGDGTVRIVAHEARKKKIPVAVVPCGTFNLFARNHEIPEDIPAALDVALSGRPVGVRVATLNEETFILNASLGLYARAIQERKTHTQRWGRHRLVAVLSTLWTMTKGHSLMDLSFTLEGQTQRARTTMVFIGNNSLQLRHLSMQVAECMKKKSLAVVTLKDMSGWKMLKLVFHGIGKKLENLEELDSFCASQIKIESSKSTALIALDGEMFRLEFPLEIKAEPEGLLLVKRAFEKSP